MDEHQYDDIRHEVRQGMNGICHHRGTMPHDACHKLKQQQHHIDDAAHQRHLIDFLIPFHCYLPAKIQNNSIRCYTLSKKMRIFATEYERNKEYRI